jgi:hypothetical protein
MRCSTKPFLGHCDERSEIDRGSLKSRYCVVMTAVRAKNILINRLKFKNDASHFDRLIDIVRCGRRRKEGNEAD